MHFLLLLLSSLVLAQDPPPMEWKADYYERDLKTNTTKARGNAWFKQGTQEVWADEIEVNFNTNWAYASGNAHFFDGKNDIFADRGQYALSGKEATLEDAVVISGQMVISGKQIRKLSQEQFEMDEGIYTNCNTQAIRDKSAATCPFDWKIYGKHFSVTIEGYAHIYDAIIHVKDLPVAYIPYYIAPAKSKRQSGFLNVQLLTGKTNIGSGSGIPFFWALGSWHDLTIDPMYYSKAGMHLGLNYNYAYARDKLGTINLYGTQRRYSTERDSPSAKGTKNHLLGEWAVDIHNQYSLGGRTMSRQSLTLVSDPYYPIDFAKDLSGLADKSYLRSQLLVISPSDHYQFTGAITHFQSLVMPKDSGVDKGSVTQLPSLTFSQKSRPSFLNYLSYEIDTRFSNFYRPNGSFDTVPLDRNPTTPIPVRPNFADNDYVRTGQRFQIEPRAVLNVPLASGFQLQPLVKTGALFYHFDAPDSSGASQRYVDAELPFSMYLARNYQPDFAGLKKIRHIFQPKIMYAVALHRSGLPSHPFFTPLDQPRPFYNPRFDLNDQLSDFEYLQVELNNRFMRDTGTSTERFLLVTLKNQLNSRRSSYDRRYRSKIGPVSLLVDFGISPISFQLQGDYQVERVNQTNESDWTGTLTYTPPSGDSLTLNGLYRLRDNRDSNELRYNLSFVKKLPVFLDVSGSFDYNALKGEPRSLSLGLTFAAKPVSCWSLTVSYSKYFPTSEVATLFTFGFNFGGPMTMSSSKVGI